MVTYNAPMCSTCHIPSEQVDESDFACPKCGQLLKGIKVRSCPVCQLPVSGSRRELRDYRAALTYKFYAHNPCYELIKKEVELDNQQFDVEIELYKVAMTMPCPDCKTPDILLIPIDIGKGYWSCTSCGQVFEKEWMNQRFTEHNIPPLKCLRCGETYDLTTGHECELRLDYKLLEVE